jgi:hypothetical protein
MEGLAHTVQDAALFFTVELRTRLRVTRMKLTAYP